MNGLSEKQKEYLNAKKTKKKTCPMYSIHNRITNECSEDSCAWYNDHWKQCSILDISQSLNGINEGIDSIRNSVYRP